MKRLLLIGLLMIITRFGDTFDAAYVFPTLKASDDFNYARPVAVQPRSGRDGAFDTLGDDNAPMASCTITKTCVLSASTYAALETALDAIKAATVGQGRSKVWGVTRGGDRRWAWGKVVNADYPESRDHSNLTLPMSFTIWLPVVEWYADGFYGVMLDDTDPSFYYLSPNIEANTLSLSFNTVAGSAYPVFTAEDDGTGDIWATGDFAGVSPYDALPMGTVDYVTGEVGLASVIDEMPHVAPASWPVTFTYNISGGELTLTNAALTGTATNAGNLPAAPVITMTNGSNSATGFTLTNAANGHTFTYTGTIDSTDEIIIDCRALAVTLNGVDAFDNLTYGANQQSWLMLESGDNPLTLSLAGSSGTKTLVVEWYDTYL